MKKLSRKIWAIIALFSILAFLLVFRSCTRACTGDEFVPAGEQRDVKPVIYLYPEVETLVDVKLDYAGRLTCTYPEYKDGWCLTASPDGQLVDENGIAYNYLYWEGESDTQYDFTKGFCVAGEDSAKFLEESLAKLGLNRREANEFIVYWLPILQENHYNLISFQTEAYEGSAKLSVIPECDTVIRVFMAIKPLATAIDIEEQILVAPERTGFTLVEWGGCIVK